MLSTMHPPIIIILITPATPRKIRDKHLLHYLPPYKTPNLYSISKTEFHNSTPPLSLACTRNKTTRPSRREDTHSSISARRITPLAPIGSPSMKR
ncbi:hypothetical protein CDAR_418821 [Caerostris darwini]|uniref:Uncharacterized protein n=1 Tax=Caerostris darwini TaxID=1538125 RepID=A0AAV4MV41_9ARAC|nr:hypothetical protein CDAR_418821 [Caerostris darwini]